MLRLQQCPGVIQLLDSFEDDDSVHIVTELCPGGDLAQYVEAQGALDEANLAMVAAEVLSTVKGCHELGVLHGARECGRFAPQRLHLLWIVMGMLYFTLLRF